MCGFLCEFAKKEGGATRGELFERMLAQLSRRGPDHTSTYRRNQIALGHTRLSVIDLETGNQPIFNEARTVACVLNGEIYNFRHLRSMLEGHGHQFTTRSDAEVIVHLYEEYGLDVFSHLKGMFAIAIADYESNRLVVARDRLGEKPVYILDTPATFCSGSELKSLMLHPEARRQIAPAALASYLRNGYVTSPHSIWESCRKLPPAHFVVVTSGGTEQHCYWRPRPRDLGRARHADLAEMVRDELASAVDGKLVSDVPIGVFLSGGLDSSVVTAFAAKSSPEPLRTFSVGFGDAIDELPFAKEVAGKYGTIHTALQVTPELEDIDIALRYVDEPFADSSLVPTLAVSREARKHVKVVLTGDGGDELFGGYGEYLDQAYFCRSKVTGGAMRRVDSLLLAWTGRRLIDSFYPLPQPRAAFAARSRFQDLRGLFTPKEIQCLLPGGLGVPWPHANHDHIPLPDADPLTQAFGFDINVYLPDDLLKKVDMASMYNGLECRAPLLDHELVEFAMGVPSREKLRRGVTKTLVREAMRGDLPESVLSREKHGFGAPLLNWLTGPLSSQIMALSRSGSPIHRVLDSPALARVLDDDRRQLNTDWRAPLRLWSLYALAKWCEFNGM